MPQDARNGTPAVSSPKQPLRATSGLTGHSHAIAPGHAIAAYASAHPPGPAPRRPVRRPGSARHQRLQCHQWVYGSARVSNYEAYAPTPYPADASARRSAAEPMRRKRGAINGANGNYGTASRAINGASGARKCAQCRQMASHQWLAMPTMAWQATPSMAYMAGPEGRTLRLSTGLRPAEVPRMGFDV